MIKGHRRSLEVMEGHGRSRKLMMVFSHHWIDISGEKSYWMWGVWVVACRIIVSVPVPFPLLWTLDFVFGTWIWDLDLGLGFETGLGLDVLLLDQVLTIDI